MALRLKKAGTGGACCGCDQYIDCECGGAGCGLTCESKAATAELCGFSEFTDPSTPPKYYRKKTTTGTMTEKRWDSEDCPTENACGAGRPTEINIVNQSVTFTSPLGFSRPGRYTLRVVPIEKVSASVWKYHVSGSVEDLSGESVPFGSGTINVPGAGDVAASGTEVNFNNCPTFSGNLFAWFRMGDGFATTWYEAATFNEFIAPPAGSPIEEVVDTWDKVADHAPLLAGDPPVCVPTVTDDSERERNNESEEWPFTGLDPAAAYAGRSTVTAEPAERTTEGDGECVNDSGESTELTGTVVETLSDEDTMSDAEGRAMADIEEWTACTLPLCTCPTLSAFRTSPAEGGGFGFRAVRVKANGTGLTPSSDYVARVRFFRRVLGTSGPYLFFAQFDVGVSTGPEETTKSTDWIEVPNEAGWETIAGNCSFIAGT